MDMTVFRSGTGLVEPSPVGPEEGQPGPSANTPSRPRCGCATVRILSDPEELAAAYRRAEDFERRSTEHQAARAKRHQAALSGAKRAVEVVAQ